MSYQTVKDGICGILNTLGYAEAPDVDNFKDITSIGQETMFIVRCLSGEQSADSNTLQDRFYDIQKWEIMISFPRTSQNDLINRDEIHREKDRIINYLDNPDKWRSFVRFARYDSWGLDMQDSSFILTITMDVIDTYIYN